MSRTGVTVLRGRRSWPGRPRYRQPGAGSARGGRHLVPGCRSRNPQVCLDDLLGDRRGRGGTEATALYHDADSYRSVADAFRGEAGEYRIVQDRAVLRGAGLAGDLEVGHEDVVRRAGR